MTRLGDSNLLVELIDIEPINETWNVYPDIVETKAAILHLLQCGLPAPALIDHPVKRGDQSRAISAQRTVQKRWTHPGLAPQGPQRADDILPLDVPGMHFEIKQAQSQALGQGIVRVGRAQVHHRSQSLANYNSLEARFGRLGTAIEVRPYKKEFRDLRKISNFLCPCRIAAGGRTSLRILRLCRISESGQKQRERREQPASHGNPPFSHRQSRRLDPKQILQAMSGASPDSV